MDRANPGPCVRHDPVLVGIGRPSRVRAEARPSKRSSGAGGARLPGAQGREGLGPIRDRSEETEGRHGARGKGGGAEEWASQRRRASPFARRGRTHAGVESHSSSLSC